MKVLKIGKKGVDEKYVVRKGEPKKGGHGLRKRQVTFTHMPYLI